MRARIERPSPSTPVVFFIGLALVALVVSLVFSGSGGPSQAAEKSASGSVAHPVPDAPGARRSHSGGAPPPGSAREWHRETGANVPVTAPVLLVDERNRSFVDLVEEKGREGSDAP